MAEKKIQENPLPEDAEVVQGTEEVKKEPCKMGNSEKSVNVDKGTSTNIPMPSNPVPAAQPAQTRVQAVPIFTKTPPNDLYRKLLPAVLFLLTFVTVMTMLLIYMDTVALGAQQFRLNMSRDYDLSGISQDSPSLVAYVRQLHLSVREGSVEDTDLIVPKEVAELDRLLGKDFRGTYVEALPSGPSPVGAALGRRGWRAVVARASPQDYLALRGPLTAVQACLSPNTHPKEVAYHAPPPSWFTSRVLCLPLATVLLAAEAPGATVLALGGGAAHHALHTVPLGDMGVKVVEMHSSDPAVRNETIDYLSTKNYTLFASFDDAIMFKANNLQPMA